MVSSLTADNVLITGAFEVFRGSTHVLYQYAPLVFLGRVLLNILFLRGKLHFGLLLQDIFLFFAGIYCFEHLMSVVIDIPAQVSHLLGETEPPTLTTSSEKLTFWGALDLNLGEFLDAVSVWLYWIITWIYLTVVAICICLGAYIIFFATMFRMKWVFSVFLIFLISASMWPFLWHAVDQVFLFAARNLDKSGAVWGIISSKAFTGLLKIVIPIGTFFYALKDPVGLISSAMQGVKSGIAPLTSLGSKGVESTKSIGRAVGIDTVLHAQFRPLSEKIGVGRVAFAEKLRDSAPYALYTTERMLRTSRVTSHGTTNDNTPMTFNDFKNTHMKIGVQNLRQEDSKWNIANNQYNHIKEKTFSPEKKIYNKEIPYSANVSPEVQRHREHTDAHQTTRNESVHHKVDKLTSRERIPKTEQWRETRSINDTERED